MRRALTVAALVASAVLAPTVAHAADQPYGGCKEGWMAPHSAGAAACRADGWTVKERIVVSPTGLTVRNTLKPCPTEDSRTLCFWDGTYRGNGRGQSFWVGRDGRWHAVARFVR